MKMSIFQAYRRINALLISLVFCASLLVPAGVHAAESGSRTEADTVRVGWYQSDMFQEGTSDNETKSGYCYDYLQKVADYTAWKYEYVYGNWTELFRKLQTGEIDFLAGVSLTEERKETMLFPDSPMGEDQYYLYKSSDDDTISVTDISTLKGKKVGSILDNRITTFTEQWIEENGVDMEIVCYESFEDQENAFKNGEIDLFTQTVNNVLRMENIEIVAKVGEEPFYLAVSRDRNDLLYQLNTSLSTITSINPFALQNMQYDNYGATLISRTMSGEEKQWVSSHSRLIFGYLDNYLPFSSTDGDGQATGVMVDVVEAILRELGLGNDISLEYRAFENYNEMVESLKNGEVNIAFPVYGNPWDLEKDGINASSEVITSNESFFYKKTYSKENVKTVAVNKNNMMQIAYVDRVFPNAQKVYFSSIQECLSAVAEGKADGTVVNTLRTELVTRNSKYDSLSYVQLKTNDSRCFGVNEYDVALLSLLNRGLRLIGSSYGIDNSYKYIEKIYSYTAMDFIKENLVAVGITLTAAVCIVILLLMLDLRRKSLVVKEKEMYIRRVDSFNRELEELKMKADSANAAKTLFLNNMSHDMRTPMNAIIGYTNIAANQSPKPEVKKCLDKILESSEHLLSLINDVLDISRIESGKIKINLAPVKLRDITDEVLSIINGFLIERKLTINIHRENTESVCVMADSLRIREVLVNILSNAVKFTDDDGTITFAEQTLPGSEEGHILVRYTVADNGIGISEEFQKHIFDEFSQENDSSARTQYKGTGLGMTITKRYVDMMGGTISVQSEKGKGTTFTVEIPMEKTDNTAVKKAEAPELCSDISGSHILLAEDNDLNAEIAIIQLEEAGVKVTRAADGKQAVDIFKNNPPDTFDAILMDVMMPQLNGYEATRAIRAMDGRADSKTIPIVAMTANAFAEDIQASLNAGMNAHLAKPLVFSEMLKTISQLIHKEA